MTPDPIPPAAEDPPETRSTENKLSELTKSRFLTIDALRGIAAFLVVLFHVYGGGAVFQVYLAADKLTLSNTLYALPGFGYAGVYLFFVISGFCIHLRWAKARAKDDQISPKIDFFAFWKRRWIRLYPAYIAAMVLFLVWEYYQGKIVFNGFFIWDMVAHVLMIHNLDNRTVYSMNGVFWTLAIEEQLYMLYFLMIYLRERWGWLVTIGVTFASRFLWLGVSLMVTKFTGFELPFSEGSLANWWIWAMGALAVENFYRVTKFPTWCYSRALAVFMLGSACVMHYLAVSTPATPTFSRIAFVFEPILWGAGFFLLINFVTSVEANLRNDGFEFRMIAAWAFVGLFSYSLYLTHELVIQPMQGFNGYLISLICLLFAYIFFIVFEKPFMVYLAKQKRVPIV